MSTLSQRSKATSMFQESWYKSRYCVSPLSFDASTPGWSWYFGEKCVATPKLEHSVSSVWCFDIPSIRRCSRKHKYKIYVPCENRKPSSSLILRRDVGICYAEMSCHSVLCIISSHRRHMLFYRASSVEIGEFVCC